MKPSILIFVGHYLPGYRMGGPLRSIVNLVEHLHGEFDFRIVTSDRDLGDAEPYRDIEVDRWVRVGPAQVRYLSPARQRLPALKRLMRKTPHDLLYLNSFFSPRSTILPLLARRMGSIGSRPTVLAPRGEFSEGALALKSAKKRIYLEAGKAAGLFSGIVWQASSDREVGDIRKALGGRVAEVHVAMNLSSPLGREPPPHTPRDPGAPLRVLFLGRISPMKNLDYALRVLASVRVPVNFSIVGPPENAAYLAECERLAKALPAHVAVRWLGAAEPAEVPRLMAEHDLFFLPTRGENYGHVIAETLGAGTPVLISDATPWRGLVGLGVGDDLPLADPAAFSAAIERAAAHSPQEAAARRLRAFTYACERQKTSDDVDASRRLFTAALVRAGH